MNTVQNTGEEDKQARDLVPPYGSYKTFVNFIDGLRQIGDPPYAIDRSMMSSLSGATQSHLLHSLRSLGLIDEAGIPSEKLVKLIKADEPEMVEVLRDIVTSAYSFLFHGNFIRSATTRQFEDKFRETGASGETLLRCISFFTNIAKQAQIELSPHLKPYRLNKNSERKPKSRKAKSDSVSKNLEGQNKHRESEPEAAIPPEVKLWIDKFPEFNQEWEESLKQEWIKNWRETFDWLTNKKSKSDTED